jgi:capsular exopolysaccharide synthesis family protein
MNRPSPNTSSSNAQKWIVQKLLLRLMRNWQWITIFVLVSIVTAFVTNRYSNKIYESQVKVVKGNEDASADGAAFVLGNNRFNSILNTEYERAFFTSSPILEEIIKDLNLQVFYYSQGYVRTYERFGDLPITLLYDLEKNSIPYNIRFGIIVLNENTFSLTSEQPEWKLKLQGKKFSFGELSNVEGFSFTIQKNFPIENRGNWMFMINQLADLTSYYKWSIRVDVSSQYGREAMLRLSMLSTVPEKDVLFLNRLVEEIRKRDVQRKVESSGRTLSFIDSQMQAIADSMEFIAIKLRDQKLNNQSLSAGSTEVFSRVSAIEDQKAQLVLANRYCDYLKDYITSRINEEIIVPSVLGIENALLNGLLKQYIDMRLKERTDAQLDLSSRVYQKDRVIKEKEMKAFEEVVIECIFSTKQSNYMQMAVCDQQVAEFMGAARNTMNEEIVSSNNERLYSMNEKIFTLLMDKKAVAGISRAALISDYRQLESASYNSIPLQPKSSRNYLAALAIGLLIPIAFLFERTITKNNLLSLSELEELIHIPVLGMIGNNPNPTVVKDEPKSLVAENFRTLRSNLKYIKEGSDQLVLLVTSSITEEGKSFVTSNLGYALGLQGKKTIVIGADLRKPTLKAYFGKSHGPGLSEYLSGQVEINEIINQSEDPNLSYIQSGPVPPNPAELLSGHRMSELISKLKKDYAYVLLDTPPVGTISDAAELFELADAIILVTRQEVTPVAALQQLNYFFDKASMAKTVVLFNGVKMGGGYGYYGYRFGYGYGYGEYYRS